MSVRASSLRQSGKYRFREQAQQVRPQTIKELQQILDPQSSYPPPFRPMGAGSSSTDCTTSTVGTVVDMTAFTEIINVDAYNDTVTCQAGVRIATLIEELAEHGLELVGSHDLLNRTVGGAVAGGCIGPSIGDDGGFFASQVISIKLVTPDGKRLEVKEDSQNLLNAFRLSYGMLGIIYQVTMRVRPITPFAATHRRCTVKAFSAAVEKLSKVDIGVKFYLLPFRDCVYLDLRKRATEELATRKIPWKIKDWGESTVLPHVFKSLNRIVPVSGVRYRMIDAFSRATQGIVNNRLVRSGSNATAQSNVGHDSDPMHYSTWLFPAGDFAIVVQTYAEFCRRIHAETGFRCDMPTVGFRLSADRSAMLSPCFDEPMFALRAVSTQSAGWEDFAIDFAEFAQHWGGSPFFNQTRSLSPDYASEIFGSRFSFFRKIRRQLDPDNRMMNPFLSQYFL